MSEHASESETTVRNPGRGESASAPTFGATVLPRVEWEGATPRLSSEQRPRFAELGSLGRGGMGEVVLARDNDIERAVALKRLPPRADTEAVARFVEEIRTVGRLEHPNIVTVHDVGIDAHGRYFFVMKHLEGETLTAIIQRLRDGDAATHARYPFAERVQLFLGVLNAVSFAHQQGFVHRDLKPSNIMVGTHGEVTVLDWGIAKRLQGGAALPAPTHDAAMPSTASGETLHTSAGMLMGTPAYMSPEQARGEHDTLDARADVYSLCVVLHELLYLRHYLHGLKQTDELLQGAQHTRPSLWPEPAQASPHQDPVPSELGWVLYKGLEKDPAARFASVDELGAALRRALRGRFGVQCHRTLLKRALHLGLEGVERHPAAAWLASLAGLSLGAAGLWSALTRLWAALS